MGELFLVTNWVNLDNHKRNGYGVIGYGVRGGVPIIFDPISSLTLNLYEGLSRAVNLQQVV